MNIILEQKNNIINLAVTYVPQGLLALATLVVGLWLIGGAVKLLLRGLSGRGVDTTLAPFIGSLFSWVLKAVLFISVASMIGIQTTSLVAILGAAGLAVGLALQGSLSNFAGGVLLLLFRPYKVGDLIKAQDVLGVVAELQIFTTTLVTPDNLTAIVPNGPMSNGTIINFTRAGKMRVDLEVGIAYSADIGDAKRVLRGVLDADSRVLKSPEPTVAVKSLDDSAVTLVVRPFCKPADYWGVYFDVTEKAKLALDAAGVSIPFPQRDVHLFQHPSA